MSYWGLAIKASNREVMAPLRAADTSVTDESKWPVVQTMRVLGHYLQHDGSTDYCFDVTLKQCWKAFFANCMTRHSAQMPVTSRLSLLSRAVLPVLRFRWTRWPFTISRAQLLDGVQGRMLSIILGIRPLPDETPERFVRRRGTSISSLQKKIGYWGKRWASAVVGWAEHLERPRNASTWAARVSAVRSPFELEHRRQVFGRPQTRMGSGFIRRRWFESVEFATSHRDSD